MKVFIAAVGFTKVGNHPEQSILDLAAEASITALQGNRKFLPDQIVLGNMFSSSSSSQEHLSAMLADTLGLDSRPAYKVESACSSGATAFNVGCSLLKSGEVDSVLVVGVEKMRDLSTAEASLALAMAESAEYTQFFGATFAALNGLLARYYMEQEGVEREELSAFPVISHRNAVTVEHAQFRKEITPEAVANSPMISDSLTLLDCAPIGDGAAAALLVNESSASRVRGNLVEVLGGGLATNRFSLYERDDMLNFMATRKAFKKAMTDAALPIGKIDLIETHDAFSVVAALSLEAMGLSKRGRAAKDALAGKFDLDGDLPISTYGGLKARGHPVGATGVYQIAEAFLQLTDRAGKNQVKDADFAVTQNIGGVDTTSAVHVLGRTD
jgi:acetyl-CoA acetyltransferase